MLLVARTGLVARAASRPLSLATVVAIRRMATAAPKPSSSSSPAPASATRALRQDDASDTVDPSEDAVLRELGLSARDRLRSMQEKSTVRRALEAIEPSPASASAASPSADKATAAKAAEAHGHGAPVDASKPWLQRTWVKVKEVLHHYWVGTKLLAAETRLSASLLVRMTQGHTLTRRERLQLTRSASDMFRLVPFIIIVIVPFAEFALPILLRFFPNMLPSTFEEQSAKEEKKRRLLKVRLEMAKFLQDATKAMAVENTSQDQAGSQFDAVLRKLKETDGATTSADDVLALARYFDEHITLQSISPEQLQSLCKYLNVYSFGPRSILEYNLQQKLRQLKDDDRWIAGEGVDAMADNEIIAACTARGIDSDSPGARERLRQWIHMSTVKNVPPVLLVLHGMMRMSTGVSLAKAVVSEVAAAAQLTQTITESKLEAVKRQALLIEQEAKKPAAAAGAVDPKHIEILSKLDEAVAIAVSRSPAAPQRDELGALKADRVEFKDDVVDLKATGVMDESKASKRLGTKVDSMISQLEKEIADLEASGKGSIPTATLDENGQIGAEDLRKVIEALATSRRADRSVVDSVIASLDTNKDGRVALQEIQRVAEFARVTAKTNEKVDA